MLEKLLRYAREFRREFVLVAEERCVGASLVERRSKLLGSLSRTSRRSWDEVAGEGMPDPRVEGIALLTRARHDLHLLALQYPERHCAGRRQWMTSRGLIRRQRTRRDKGRGREERKIVRWRRMRKSETRAIKKVKTKRFSHPPPLLSPYTVAHSSIMTKETNLVLLGVSWFSQSLSNASPPSSPPK